MLVNRKKGNPLRLRKIQLRNLSGYILQKQDFFYQFSDINVLIFHVNDYIQVRNLFAGLQDNIIRFKIIKDHNFFKTLNAIHISKLELCLHIFFVTEWKNDFFIKASSNENECLYNDNLGMFLIDYIGYVQYFCNPKDNYICRLLDNIK